MLLPRRDTPSAPSETKSIRKIRDEIAGGGVKGGRGLTKDEEQLLARIAVERFAEFKVPGKQGEFWNNVAAALKEERRVSYTPSSCTRRMGAIEKERRLEVKKEESGEERNTSSWAQSIDAWIALKDAWESEKAELELAS
ncbi:hypothetical protein KCU81_g9653, partial [Aureobasidium melanogenum]